MEFLSQKATIVFGELLNRIENAYLKIENVPYMPLTMELIGVGIETPWGMADLYSLCHYYEQNGDLMQDPEMCFLVTDNRNGFNADFGKLKIAPYMFQQANLGIYQDSIKIENSKLTKFLRKQQKQQTDFANTWLTNIREQGFLTK
ncbi:DUF6908 domain-containing protein [Sphingobacterium siyangense]|uniref:DUF6908 domain-containing protein n=1 Tax=Sphingobacterium siyangense TaxID=459529 RepID=UPI002FDCC5DB